MLYRERRRRGAAIMPGITEILARLALGQTLDWQRQVFGKDEDKVNEFNKRCNTMIELNQEMLEQEQE